MHFRTCRVIILFIFAIAFSYVLIAVHNLILSKISNYNFEIDIEDLTVEEIQEIYTRDYSKTDIQTRVLKEREQIEKLPDDIKAHRLPDVILIGIFKGGTGTTTSWLSKHPQIEKVKYSYEGFCEESYTYADYISKLPNISDDKIIFERTICYSNHVARERMAAAYLKRDVKLLIVLRDPIDRLISGYFQKVTAKDKNESFEEHLCSNNGILQMNNDCNNSIRTSVYVSELAKWLQVFPRENIHLVDGDSFIKTPWIELEKIERLLKIDHFFSEDRFPPNPEKPSFRCFVKYNETEATCMGEMKGRSHPIINEDTIQKLRKFFKPYNEQLFTLAGQRFSWSVNYD